MNWWKGYKKKRILRIVWNIVKIYKKVDKIRRKIEDLRKVEGDEKI